MTEAEALFSQRGQLLEGIAVAADEIKAIDDRLEFLRSIEFEKGMVQTTSRALRKSGKSCSDSSEIAAYNASFSALSEKS